MRRLYILTFCLLSFFACDDGDILTVDLDFNKELDYCDNNVESFLIYDLREDPNESLSLRIPRSANQEFPFTESTADGLPETFTINGTSVRFIYRTYNRAVGDTELCQSIPPADLNIVEDYEATAGDVQVIVTIEDDDGDGIPSDLEGRGEMDAEGNFPNALNTDGDEFPDYLDEDDDNDNVKTALEIDTENLDEDDNPLTNPLDTDGDGTADYLDNDDDGDGVLTRLEDESGEKNPRDTENLVVDQMGENVYRYLYNNPDDPNSMEAFDDLGFTNDNVYNRVVTASFLVSNFNLEIIAAQQIDFGILTYNFNIEQEDED